MEAINALSIAPDARDWLASSRHPRILHVFDQGCNLINERRQVLSIVTQKIGNGPFNLVVDHPIIFSERLKAESQITLDSSCLRVGQITVNLENAKLWSPRPGWETLHANKDGISDQIMSLRGPWFSARSNLLANLETSSPSRIASRRLATTSSTSNYQSLIFKLSFALANAEIPSALRTTSQLAGLGAGLTPAGDDFILGAILAAWIIHPPEIAKVIAEKITNTAAPLTTSLSAAWLKSAGRGEAGILWHHLFDALISANSMIAQDSIDKIRAVGETSGADALAGFIGTLCVGQK